MVGQVVDLEPGLDGEHDDLFEVVALGRPDRQHGVAREGDDVASVPIDGVDDVAEGVVQDVREALGAAGPRFREALGDRGESHHVDQQHRPVEALDRGPFALLAQAREVER